MIKAIFFDLGGVILSHSYESVINYLAKPFKISSEEAANLYQAIKDDWTLGKMNINDAANYFIKYTKSTRRPLKIIKEWIKVHEQELEFNENVLLLIKKLKKKYRLYLATNTNDLHFEVINSEGLSKNFDRVFASYQVGKRKPDIDFYKHLLKTIKLSPYECVLIDDKEENIKAARDLKIKGILFKDCESLESSLKKLKVI